MAALGTGQGAGDYLSVAKVIVMMILFAPWLYAAPWANKDSHDLKLGRTKWSVMVLAGAIVAWLLWLVIPIYAAGMIFYVLFAGGALMIYVVFRNGRVPEAGKVLTSRHLSSLFSPKRKIVIQPVTRVKFYGGHGRIITAPEAGKATGADIAIYNMVQDLLHDLVWRRASEADLAPLGNQQARLKLAIDGVAVNRPGMSAPESESVIQYLKTHGGMNVEDRRRPQEGKIAVDLGGEHYDIVLTCTGSTHGQRMRFRVVQEAVRTKLDELGMTEDQLIKVRQMVHADHGLVIVAGRPGSGMTSTLYSLLREHDAFTKVLVTLERRPAADLENVTQYAYEDDNKLADQLGSALRRDPDVAMVDHCPNGETAGRIIDFAATKHILLGMHAGDTFVALAKWVKVCRGAPECLRDLHGVLCQVLVRRLCMMCKEAYLPDQALLAKANLQGQKIDKFYRQRMKPMTDEKGNAVVCANCQGIGYVDRTAVFEILEITDTLRKLVLSGAPVRQIKAECRKNKMLYLQERALQKVIAGETSVQEVIRITQESKEP